MGITAIGDVMTILRQRQVTKQVSFCNFKELFTNLECKVFMALITVTVKGIRTLKLNSVLMLCIKSRGEFNISWKIEK